jgi:hypothetical protein
MQLRRLAVIASAATLSLGLAACGAEEEVHHGETEGVYVTTGHLKYQVQISRPLNPTDYEDREYLHGLPAGDEQLDRNQEWFAVFLRVFNRTDEAHPASEEYRITDTTGKEYEQVQIDADSNPFAFQPQSVGPETGPDDELPLPNTAGRTNTTQGGLLLFKIPTGALENRPLELHIASPAGDEPAIVTLDV